MISTFKFFVPLFIFYLMSGTSFGQTIDDDQSGIIQGNIDKRYSERIENLQYPFISPAMSWIGDITFEGQNIWAGGPTGWIYKISPLNGQILDSMDTQLGVSIDGITYGNGSLWVAQSYLGHTILKIDPVNKVILQSFVHPVPSDFTHGMMFLNNQLWINMFWIGSTDTTFVLDTLCHVVTQFPNHALFSHGLAFDGSHFWITANNQPPTNGDYLFKFDMNFQVLDSFPIPGGHYPNGLVWHNRCLWLSNAQSLSIYEMCEIVNGMDGENGMAEDEIMIYPNPSEGTLHIAFSDPEENERLDIYNSTGQLMKSIRNPLQNLIDLKIEDSKCMFLFLAITKRDGSRTSRTIVLNK